MFLDGTEAVNLRIHYSKYRKIKIRKIPTSETFRTDKMKMFIFNTEIS